MVVRGLVRRVVRGVVRRVVRGVGSVGSPRSGGQFFQLSRSAVFVEAVFESSFCFTYVLFGAVVVLYHVNGIFGVTISN